MGFKKKITKITLLTVDGGTCEVGGLYLPGSPKHGIVTSIKQERGGFAVYNDKGGRTFYASHYVARDSIVKE